jgi:quercetin dioxygenase-like cupin family protein
VREAIPAGGTTARHAHDRETYAAVLDGRLRVEFDDGPVAVDAGEFLRVPAGLRHREIPDGDGTTVLVGYVAVDAAAATGAARPPVARESDLVSAGDLAGLTRLTPFPDAPVQVVRGRADGAIESTWHHHGDNDVYGHVLAGRGYVQWGTGPDDRLVARAGDSFHVPAGLVHRDVNLDDATQAYLLWLVGSEPRTVRVDGPGGGA